MSSGEMKKKRNPGILGWDPAKKGADWTMHQCPHCWFAHHNKGVVTKHINETHWELKNDREPTTD